jgi:hypothetical protein
VQTNGLHDAAQFFTLKARLSKQHSVLAAGRLSRIRHRLPGLNLERGAVEGSSRGLPEVQIYPAGTSSAPVGRYNYPSLQFFKCLLGESRNGLYLFR